jgi:hypothetical protein
MSETIGRIIDSVTDGPSREPVTQPVNGRITEPESGSAKPEILYGTDTFDPVTERIGTGASADSGSDGVKRTKSGRIDRRTLRGRGTGAGTGEPEETPSSSVNLDKVNLTDLLLSLHAMGAAFLSTPELELDRDEAKKLSDGIQKVGKYYAMAFDPKRVAIAELAIIVGGIYGTRFVAWKNRRTSTEETTPKPGPALVQSRSAAPAQPSKPMHMTSPSELWPEGGGQEGALPI